MIVRYNRLLAEGKSGSIERAVISGFIATVLMTSVFAVAYGLAALFGSNSAQAPLLLRWTWGLAHNTVTAHAQTAVPIVVLLHFVFGIAWALGYAGLGEPRLRGPGWRRGVLFAPLPWTLSLVVFLPAVGGGFLGLGLGAGPLPIVGNLVLHLVYGATLGHLYPRESDRALIEEGATVSADEVRILARAQHQTAQGIIAGLLGGALVGWVGQTAFAPGQSVLLALTIGALGGSAVGGLIGSFAGLSPHHSAD